MKKVLVAGLLLTIAIVVATSPQAQDSRSLKLQELLGAAIAAFDAGLEIPELPANKSEDLKAGQVRIVLEATTDTEKLEARIAALGGKVESVYENLVQALVPIKTVNQLAMLDAVAWVRTPSTAIIDQGSTVSEGVRVLGAQFWQAAGIKGQGVKAAVIDLGFERYKRLLGSELPPAERVVVRSFRSDEDIENQDDPDRDARRHGTAVAEVVHDMAPEATLYLVNFETDVEFARAVDFLISEGVHVINTSLSFFTTSCPWEPAKGRLEPIVAKARAAGIFWATSVGNHATEHWQGTFDDPNNNGFHNFWENDEELTFEVNADEVPRFLAIFSWEDQCGAITESYDLLLFDSTGRQRSRASQVRSGWPIKLLFFSVRNSGTYHLKVRRVRGTRSNIRLDISTPNLEPEYMIYEGSVSVYDPAISPSAFSIGATDHRNDSARKFSSRGPTKDGRIKPDFAAPDGVRNTTFRPFFGTSAASPHAAGAAALVKSAAPNWGVEDIQRFLEARAVDRGETGKDNTYGAGRIALGDPPTKPDQPVLTVRPLQLSFQGAVGAPNPAPQELEISNGREGPLSWTAEANVPWLKLSSSSGSAPAKLAIEPDITGLKGGTHGGQIKIVSENAFNSPLIVSVILALTSPPLIGVEPARLEFKAQIGGSAPEPQKFQIKNDGTGTLNWTATATVPWLSLDPTQGTAPSTVTVSVDITKLQVGVNEGAIEISSPDAANSPVRLPVVAILEAPAAAVIGVFPAQLRFVAQANGPNPAPQLLEITNLGSGEFNWTATTKVPWLKLSAASGTGLSLLQVSVAITELAVGTHEGKITIAVENAQNSPLDLPVQLQITEGPPVGEIVTLLFSKLEFVNLSAWARNERDGCLVYKTNDAQAQRIRVTLADGSVEYDVPAGNTVTACGNILYIDLRKKD